MQKLRKRDMGMEEMRFSSSEDFEAVWEGYVQELWGWWSWLWWWRCYCCSKRSIVDALEDMAVIHEGSSHGSKCLGCDRIGSALGRCRIVCMALGKAASMADDMVSSIFKSLHLGESHKA